MERRRLSIKKVSPFLIAFALGFWLAVVRPLGPQLTQLPGDLGDGRFNNYVLEHFYRWVSGAETDYWNAPFFAPYSDTIAFSDNLLGSAPFYALMRALELDRESAFQGWYLLSFALNYAAVAFVLDRMHFKPWSAALAAFFFTFGLPVLAQELHAQLAYRFGVPLACYGLWDFFQRPRIKTLVAVVFWSAWQLFLSVYLGILLGMLLVVLLVLFLCFYPANRRWGVLWSLPERLRCAWRNARLWERIAAAGLTGGSVLAAGLLMLPYFRATQIYGFSRSWDEVTSILPRWQSYLLADNSSIWQWATRQGSFLEPYLAEFTARSEHQLFPGFALLLLLGMSLFILRTHRRLAGVFLAAAIVLAVVTFYFNGFSLYHYLWQLPGMKSMRSLTRIQLVLMFPLAVSMAAALDELEKAPFFPIRWRGILLAMLAVLLVGESSLYTHSTISKVEARQRLVALRAQLPASVPADPVLLLAIDNSQPTYASELDAMLLAQSLGWETMNGYSGNIPPGYRNPEGCADIPQRIETYIQFAGITDAIFEQRFLERVVPLGFSDCK